MAAVEGTPAAPKRQRVGEAEAMEADVPAAPGTAQQFAEGGNVHQLMPLYYGRLFPAKELCRWLQYGNDSKHALADGGFFKRREFCFTLEGDIFVRYQSFNNAAEMAKAVRDRCPAKIDIGPVFNVDPQRRNAYAGAAGGSGTVFAPTERELVFDVDMTDYDDVRTCCSGGAICNLCWPLMTVAVKVIDRGLREDFGFENILWVYSGRRGVHAWVCDKRARVLTNEQRTAVAEYFGVYKGNDQVGKKTNLSFPLHPALERSLRTVLEPYWRDVYLPTQRLLEDEAQVRSILAMVPDEQMREDFEDRWLAAGARRVGGGGSESVARWDQLSQAVQRKMKSQQTPQALRNELSRCLQQIIFAHCYPRLDVEVSKHMNHLLKAPFCVHPKTGRVCVPIDPQDAEGFDPMVVPTVAQLLNELDESKAPAAPDAEPYERTAMKDAVTTFRTTFLDPLTQSVKREFSERAAATAAAPTLAW